MEGREDYPSDAAYANFREVTAGNIAPKTLYRSSSPIDPKQGDRRFAADALLKEAGVAAVVNTSDCRFRFRGFEGFGETNYAALGDTNQVALNMGHDYPSEAFLEDMRNGLDFLSERPGPYLIHGTEGVQRTGYMCMVLEALMGASKEELLEDYLRSYEEYHLVKANTAAWQAARDEAVSNLLTFTGAADEASLGALDLVQATRSYLLEKVGLTTEQVERIVKNLSGT